MKRMLVRGMALDKLLIAVMAVSVFSTAIWNYQMKNSETWADPMIDSRGEERIKGALDDIKYHLTLADYEYDSDEDYLTIKNVGDSDALSISHKGNIVEYFIDSENNLIRRIESMDKLMAGNVSTLKYLKVGPNTVVITVTRAPYTHERENEIETLSKSYSVVVEMNTLL
ncbi:MAG: hypothetical protein V3W18_03705 [candidate division Zixibacteria bacterium]